MPSPAYQKSGRLKAGIDLDIFTLLADKPATAQELATRSGAAVRGVRILCDYLTIHGFLTKSAITTRPLTIVPSFSIAIHQPLPVAPPNSS
jgi:hypothetical protein